MTTDAHPVASSDRGGQAGRPGPRWIYLAAAVTAIAVAAVAVLLIKPGGSSSAIAGPSHLRVATKYGQDRRWLKIPEPPAVTVATASAKAPDLSAMEGYPVTAKLAGGSAQIFVEGPAVPAWVSSDASENKLRSGQSVPATYTVSFSHVAGHVPLSAGAFTLITYQGKILHPRVATANGAALPASLPTHTTMTLRLTTTVPEGDGAIRWAPVGQRILVSYFWTLEFD